MACEVEYTDEFGEWWDSLTEPEQESIACVVGMLQAKGTVLGFPYGAKVGDDRFYERMVPIADRIYEEHLRELASLRGSERK